MPNEPTTTLGDSVLALSPPWLSKGNAERFLFNIGFAQDALVEKMNQAMRAHLPGEGDPSGLLLIGNDRVMDQGPTETTPSFANRLSRAFDSWQRAGSRESVMVQALIYMLGFQAVSATQVPRAVIVGETDDSTNYAIWHTYYNTSNLDFPPAYVRISESNWNWDAYQLPWRAWLILFFEAGSGLGPGPVFGEAGVTIGEDDTISIGLDVSAGTFTGLRLLVRRWKCARSYYPWFIMSFDGGDGGLVGDFNPSGGDNPDGLWARWSKVVGGVRVASRFDDARYVDGTGIYQRSSVHTGT